MGINCYQFRTKKKKKCVTTIHRSRLARFICVWVKFMQNLASKCSKTTRCNIQAASFMTELQAFLHQRELCLLNFNFSVIISFFFYIEPPDSPLSLLVGSRAGLSVQLKLQVGGTGATRAEVISVVLQGENIQFRNSPASYREGCKILNNSRRK